jgi:hypothetical protein
MNAILKTILPALVFALAGTRPNRPWPTMPV